MQDTTAPVISSVAATPAATSAVIAWTTNELSTSVIDYGTSSSSLTSNRTDPLLVTSHRVTISGLVAGTRYYFRLRSADAAGNAAVNPSTGTSLFTTIPATASQDATVFPATLMLPVRTDSDSNSVELGMKFYADVAGYVAGVRFYKGSSNNGGSHTGTLWSGSGQKLGSVTFMNETSSGWQTAMFATPVAISANTPYVISYHASYGRYSITENYFTSSAINAGHLHVPAGAAGVYKYGSFVAFPNQTYNGSNYWVDVVFRAR